MADSTVTVRLKRSSARTNTAASVPVAELATIMEQTKTVTPSSAVAFDDLAVPANTATPYNFFWEIEVNDAPAYCNSSVLGVDPDGPASAEAAWAGVTYQAGDIDVMSATAEGEYPVFKAVA